jgi:hypothetical protein
MDTIDIDRLCKNVANAVEQVRIGFRSDIGTSGVLDGFWGLQDQLSRLVESASDRREETFDTLEREHSGLIQDIADLLSFTKKSQSKNAPAVSSASYAISRSLSTLDHLAQQRYGAMAAKA